MAKGTEALHFPDAVKYAVLGGGSPRTNRGTSQQIASAAASPVDLIEVFGNDALALPMVISCALNAVVRESNDFPAIVGRVQWGNDGFQSVAEFDFVDGAIFGVSASFARVSAHIDTDAPGNGGQDMPLVRVGAHVGYGSASLWHLNRTRYFALVEAGQVDLAIPAFARSFQVLKNSNAASVTVQILDRAGTVVHEQAGTGPISPIIPNDGRVVRVITAGALAGRLVFTLYL